MEPLISEAYAQCHSKFQELIDAVCDPSHATGGQEELKQVGDEFARFKLWAGNVGAAHSGKTYEISLDYRLKQASFYKHQVLKLLGILEDHIDRAIRILEAGPHPLEEQNQSISEEGGISDSSGSLDPSGGDQLVEDDSPWEISSHSSSDTRSSTQNPRSEAVRLQGAASATLPTPKETLTLAPPTTNWELSSHMALVQHSIHFTITCLYKLPVRHPASLDRLRQKDSIDASLYQHFDVLYVKDKFPPLDVDASSRLGKMITRRRQLLFYRDTHSQKLETYGPRAKAISPKLIGKETQATRHAEDTHIKPSQVASSHHTLETKATTLKIGEPLTEEELYAPSIAESKSSIASSFTGRELKIEIPPRPRGENGEELSDIECPYCRVAKSIRTKYQWKRHLFEDLKPYVCTFSDCGMPEHFFENREEWYKHETQYHRVTWFCNTDGHPDIDIQSDFIAHMATYHDTRLDEIKVDTLKAMFQKPSKVSSGTCNLCAKPAKRLKSHLAHHLQQISLFALPRPNATQGSGYAELDTQSSRFKGSKQTQSHESSRRSQSSSSSLTSEKSNVTSMEETLVRPREPVAEEDYVEQIDVPDLPQGPGWDEMTNKFVNARKKLQPRDVPPGFYTNLRPENMATFPKRIGVCVLDMKARSKPTRQILTRLQADGDFEVVIFGDKVIIDEDIENWPLCDFLISYFSDGFPLDKAIAYVNLRKPLLLNDLQMQKVLWDRRLCLMILDQLAIPTPRRLMYTSDTGPGLVSAELAQHVRMFCGLELAGAENGTSGGIPNTVDVQVTKDGNTLTIDGNSIRKPFVEKPVSGEDHNIIIYFPSNEGGGARRLFRKIGNKSSEYDPDLSIPRCVTAKHQSYIYEEFLRVDNGEDVKVYAVGPDYAHAETRRSPAVDGLVRRDTHGKEIRYITTLSLPETEMAAKISRGFGQRICGFGLLRVGSVSYVVDIKGFTLAKDNEEFYKNCSGILKSIFKAEFIKSGGQLDSVLHADEYGEAKLSKRASIHPAKNSLLHPPRVPGTQRSWRLKGVVIVVRNADQTPKQEITHVSESPVFLDLLKANQQNSLKDHKVLENTLEIISTGLCEILDAPGPGYLKDALLQKVEQQPIHMRVISVAHQEEDTETLPTPAAQRYERKARLLIDWGRMPVHSSRYQSQNLGAGMRDEYLLLNKDVLSDVKVFTGASQATSLSALIWTASFLNQSNVPEDFVDVREDLLDDDTIPAAALEEITKVKNKLRSIVDEHSSETERLGRFLGISEPTTVVRGFLESLKNCRDVMRQNFKRYREGIALASDIQARWCTGENLELFKLRWELLINQICDGEGDIAKIVELYEAMNHDALHNRQALEWVFTAAKEHAYYLNEVDLRPNVQPTHNAYQPGRDTSRPSPSIEQAPTSSYFTLFPGQIRNPTRQDGQFSHLRELYRSVKSLVDFIKPSTYGTTDEERLKIGLLTSLHLLREIVQDLEELQASEDSKTFVYFAQEARMHGLLNTILESGLNFIPATASSLGLGRHNLDPLAQISFELYELQDHDAEEDVYQYSIQISFSPGCHIADPLGVTLDSKHMIDAWPRRPLTRHLDWRHVIETLRAKFHTITLPKDF